mmetsp:Transcript_12305/g.33346  ORF Transcript_12305/g.33346 Transcript_12305/m.33346 type:complete len:120 (+) Transcript_12305:761-1120(+)
MPSPMPSLSCQGYAEDQQLYEIDGVVFTFGHTVLDPADGVFKHAEDVVDAKKLDHRIPVVHNLITQHHQIVVQGRTDGKEGWLMTADFMEVEESREDLQEILEKLNTQQRRFEERGNEG